MALDARQQSIMDFLHQHVFGDILRSSTASDRLKAGVRLTITRLERLPADKMIQYYWNAIIGTERSVRFASEMRREGFTRFEETIDEFRRRFDPPPHSKLQR